MLLHTAAWKEQNNPNFLQSVNTSIVCVGGYVLNGVMSSGYFLLPTLHLHVCVPEEGPLDRAVFKQCFSNCLWIIAWSGNFAKPTSSGSVCRHTVSRIAVGKVVVA